MADDPSPLNEVVDTIQDTAVEAIPLAVAPKKWLALKTAWSYFKTMGAAVGKAVPVVAVLGGGSPAISQTLPAARVEDVGPHVPSLNQGETTTLEGSNVMEEEALSALQIMAYDDIKVSLDETASVVDLDGPSDDLDDTR